jgi:hypothetical protein
VELVTVSNRLRCEVEVEGRVLLWVEWDDEVDEDLAWERLQLAIDELRWGAKCDFECPAVAVHRVTMVGVTGRPEAITGKLLRGER